MRPSTELQPALSHYDAFRSRAMAGNECPVRRLHAIADSERVEPSVFIPAFLAMLLTALCGLPAAGQARATPIATPTLNACDVTEFARVLAPAAQASPEARAYWLNRHLLKWPRMGRQGRFGLYHSAVAALAATPGTRVAGADGALTLKVIANPLPAVVAERFRFVDDGVVLAVDASVVAKLPALLKQQLVLVREDAAGVVLDATSLQIPGVLDDLYAGAEATPDLGVSVSGDATGFKLWAPTARAVSVCLYDTGTGAAVAREAMRWDAVIGIWSAQSPADMSGRYYTYLIDVFVPGTGIVRNRVTDPYSISLTTDSQRSYIADLAAPELKPEGWDDAPVSDKVAAQTDMVVYELHVRDFSINDATVSAANRGKYLAFTESDSNGMRHLRALSKAGLTDVHLLPVFDLASVREAGCIVPQVPDAASDSAAQQAVVAATATGDCFNWGYDPYHFSAPEGSYASNAADGATRIREFRAMVMALHRAGLRVGMDVVYNHTTASGQREQSVLDRIVPGYYHRLDANGVVERSTCCDNTATEHRMMGKLMIDSAVSWATQYRIDSFRFDLMGHQPRAVMEQLKRRVDAATGRDIQLIGEGWNFGEVADGARFVQASQLSLNGSGIGTFSDRARDAIRGGGPGDHGEALMAEQGYINGLVYDRNALTGRDRPRAELLHAADLVRVGLAGSLRDYVLTAQDGTRKPLWQIDYKGQPAGYVSQPGEVVNYVENHDNQTLFDLNAFKLPRATSREDRARVQVLGMALNAFSQGVAYFHAGIDTLRSKSLDRNSFDSGDWFNRLDWSYQDNYFGTGLPRKQDNDADWALMQPLLADADITPTPREITFTRDAFRDLLRIRASSTLFRLRSTVDVKQRLRFRNTGQAQNPVVIAGHLDGAGYLGANYRELLYLVNVSPKTQTLVLPEEAGKRYVLHPVQRAAGAADKRARQARFDPGEGRFDVPPRTTVVFVIE